MSNPKNGHSETNKGNGSSHVTDWWTNGGGLTHRESYDVDKHGNVSGYHYGQRDGNGTHITNNYHTGDWKDKSR